MSVSLLRIAADIQLSLAAAVTVGQTTATLSSASDTDGVALPSGKYGFTVDGDTSAKEYIVCDLVGTALTNIQNVSRQDAATTGFANYHRFGATVTITDWAILSRMLNNLNGTTGFDSAQALSYDGAVAGLTGNQIPTVNYVLSVVNGGTVTFDQQVVSNQTAGEGLTASDIVYFKESDQKWWKVDSDTAATYNGVRIGVALATVLADSTLSIAVSGTVSVFSGLTPGAKYYASSTAGGVTTTSTTPGVFLGWALSATSILLSTSPRVDAFIGAGDPPTATNRFLTETLGGSVQTFTTSGSWTKPADARWVEIIAIGGGGGGGGGGGRAGANVNGGGSGGGGGTYATLKIPAANITSPVTVTVGTGGAGGTAATSATGGTGGTGNTSSFGTYVTAAGGTGGNPGTVAGAAGAAVAGGGAYGPFARVTPTAASEGAGAGGSTDQGSTPAAINSGFVPAGGGGGAGSNGAANSTAAGVGGGITGAFPLAGGAANTAGGSQTAGNPFGGAGGGGGTTGTAGGAGGLYGAGGGGGGGNYNAVISGAGGAGANGIVVVITY